MVAVGGLVSRRKQLLATAPVLSIAVGHAASIRSDKCFEVGGILAKGPSRYTVWSCTRAGGRDATWYHLLDGLGLLASFVFSAWRSSLTHLSERRCSPRCPVLWLSIISWHERMFLSLRHLPVRSMRTIKPYFYRVVNQCPLKIGLFWYNACII